MNNTKKFTLTAMFLAILLLLALTPLGFITLGPLNSTTMHIPVIIGVVPYFAYKWLNKLTKEKAQPVSLFVAGVLGSATNTILVMNMIYFLFNSAYAEIIGKAGTAVYLAIIATIFSSGVPEALVAGVAASAIASVLLRLMKRNATQKL